MKIAIASGKGGTGKTTVTVSLSLAIHELTKKPVIVLDCDVEEPNVHIFFSVQDETKEKAYLKSCSFDLEKCTGCGHCAQVCRFNAIAVVQKKPIFFSDLCHGCGGCILICEEKAISSHSREIGTVVSGACKDYPYIHLRYGLLNVGEIMSPPLIEAVLKTSNDNRITLIDAPPGTSCPMVHTVEAADFVVLVAEPTAFGLNDLTIAVETLRLLLTPFAVIINRDGIGDDRVEQYCHKENIPILTKIPHSRTVAHLYSKGENAWGRETEFTESIMKAGRILVERFQS
jgi:MinD superfamily P-loop ATPase